MTVDFSYLLRKDEAGAMLRELDDVAIRVAVTTDDGETVPAGTEGTIVGASGDSAFFYVEFAEPEGSLATVPARNLRRVARHAP